MILTLNLTQVGEWEQAEELIVTAEERDDFEFLRKRGVRR